MAKIPFNIKFRPQIESGEYKVETRDGKPVRIICWDMDNYHPIVALVANYPNYNGSLSEHLFSYGEEGAYAALRESDEDLFLVTPEEELTDFEKKLWEVLKSEGSPIGPIEKFTNEDKEVFHSYAAELLALARKELEPEVLKRLEEAYKNQDEVVYENGKRDGKAEALKGLPRWRKCADADMLDSYTVKHWIVRFDNDIITESAIIHLVDNDIITESAIIHLGHYIGFADLEKLPGFKED